MLQEGFEYIHPHEEELVRLMTQIFKESFGPELFEVITINRLCRIYYNHLFALTMANILRQLAYIEKKSGYDPAIPYDFDEETELVHREVAFLVKEVERINLAPVKMIATKEMLETFREAVTRNIKDALDIFHTADNDEEEEMLEKLHELLDEGEHHDAE